MDCRTWLRLKSVRQPRVRKGGLNDTATFRTKVEAAVWAAAIENDLAESRAGLVPNRTFGELLLRYSEEVSPSKRGGRWEQIRIAMLIRDYTALCNTWKYCFSNSTGDSPFAEPCRRFGL